MTISSFSLAEFGLLKFYRISVLAANSFMEIQSQNLIKKKGAVPVGRAPDGWGPSLGQWNWWGILPLVFVVLRRSNELVIALRALGVGGRWSRREQKQQTQKCPQAVSEPKGQPNECDKAKIHQGPRPPVTTTPFVCHYLPLLSRYGLISSKHRAWI